MLVFLKKGWKHQNTNNEEAQAKVGDNTDLRLNSFLFDQECS